MPVRGWDEERTREQALRRRARERGLEFGKAYGQDVWFLFNKQSHEDTARVFYSLDEASAALPVDEAGVG